MKKLILFLLLIPSLVFAGANPYIIGIVSDPGCGSDSVDTQNIAAETGSLTGVSTLARGQSFQCSAGSLSAIDIAIGFTSGAELEVRVGTTADLSTYSATKTYTVPGDGDDQFHKIIFDTPVSVSASTTYYFGIVENSGDARISYSGDEYGSSSLSRRDGTSGDTWNLTTVSSAIDLRFKVYLCD